MREISALIVVVAELPLPLIAVVVFLIVVVVILVGIILLFRRQGKKKGGNAPGSATAADWQRQGQQQKMQGGWNQVGTGNAGDNTWGQHQQASSLGSQQQPGAWGTLPLTQQPGWGTPPPAQQQQAPLPYASSSSAQPPPAVDPSTFPSPAQQGNVVQPTFLPSPTFAPPTSNNPDLPMWGQAQVPKSIAPNTTGFGSNNDDRTTLRAAPASSQSRNLALEHLQFTAFHPRVVQLGTWSTLLVYAYIDSALKAIRADAAKFKDELGTSPGVVDAWASRPLTRGTQITIVPTCRGITFNPERISFTWLEDWHPAKFRFQADRSWTESIGNGEITIYGGPLIIASLKISLRFVEQNLPSPVEGNRNMTEISAYLYKRIFASYNHADTPIVLACRNAYKALGLDHIIDIDNLRSGQVWSAELMKMIETSDLFQLFWSERSAQSQFVRQEWQYALQHYKGEGFIRPVYWEKPLVSPPTDLSHLHFEYILLPRLETPDHIPPTIPRLGVVRMEEGKEPGRIYELRKRSLSIGRSRESDIFLEDQAVSRLHASIESIGNENYALKDEGSANGTKLNGQMVNKYQTYTLREGDRIQLGQTVLVFSRQ